MSRAPTGHPQAEHTLVIFQGLSILQRIPPKRLQTLTVLNGITSLKMAQQPRVTHTNLNAKFECIVCTQTATSRVTVTSNVGANYGPAVILTRLSSD
jgi:hypothetical protein